METMLATEIAPGRIVSIGKGEVSYRVEDINWARAVASIVSIDALNVKLHKTVDIARLRIEPHAPENQIPVPVDNFVSIPEADQIDPAQPKRDYLQDALSAVQAELEMMSTPEDDFHSGRLSGLRTARRIIENLVEVSR